MKVLVTGAGGMLARALLSSLEAERHDVVPLSHRELDVTSEHRVRDVVSAERPDVVMQCAAYTRVDDAERNEARAFAVNATGARNVARACRRIGARFVYPSSDYVFDGSARVPYSPAVQPAPLSAYGRTKRAGEEAAAEAGDFMIVRTSWLYGAGGRHFVGTIVRRALAGAPLLVVDDQRGAPTWTQDIAVMFTALVERGSAGGVYHATNAGDASWFELATATLELAGLDAAVEPVSTDEFAATTTVMAVRPRYSVLDCSATYAITGAAPHWRDALARAIAAGVHEG